MKTVRARRFCLFSFRSFFYIFSGVISKVVRGVSYSLGARDGMLSRFSSVKTLLKKVFRTSAFSLFPLVSSPSCLYIYNISWGVLYLIQRLPLLIGVIPRTRYLWKMICDMVLWFFNMSHPWYRANRNALSNECSPTLSQTIWLNFGDSLAKLWLIALVEIKATGAVRSCKINVTAGMVWLLNIALKPPVR